MASHWLMAEWLCHTSEAPPSLLHTYQLLEFDMVIQMGRSGPFHLDGYPQPGRGGATPGFRISVGGEDGCATRILNKIQTLTRKHCYY